MSAGRAPAREGVPVVEAVGVTKVYPLRGGLFSRARGEVRAVDGVTLAIRRGETLGLVGESGSGKSTLGRIIARLEPPTAGEIRLDGEDWLGLSGAALRRRRRDVQIVFQDPFSSLNPAMRVGAQIAEPLRVQRLARGRQLAAATAALLDAVGLPASAARRLPSALSGGQRQRVAIARALATRPRFLVCDEPVSSLDVSVGAQIVNLLLELKEKMALSTLFISHDLAVVSAVADRVAVMYAGRIVEEGPVAEIVTRPLHPYTAALLSAAGVPDAAGTRRRRIVLEGEPPRTASATAGCPFHPRCPIARPRCAGESPFPPSLRTDHPVACFFPGELAPDAPAPAGAPV